MSSLRPTRYFNSNTYQLLQIATILLYFAAGSSLLSHLLQFGSPTPFYLLGLKLGGVRLTSDGGIIAGSSLDSARVIANLLEAVAIVGLAYAAAMIASSRKLGWQLGVGLASGLVAIPVLVLGISLLGSPYLFTWMFDVALLVALLHPTSRSYQKIWFS